MSRIVSKDEFLKRAKQVHGDKYDYSKSNIVKMYEKICIICPRHGEFWQVAQEHLHGKGCRQCGNERIKNSKIKSFNNFLEKAIAVHGNKYDYSKVEYKTREDKICINCPEHGEFWQTPQNHLSGRGCPKCANEAKNKNRIIRFDEFVRRANEKHKTKYKYIEKDIKNEKEKIDIICPEHGIFSQEISSHLHGHGCPKCSHSVSNQEQEIIDFLRENNIEIIERTRNLFANSKKEIDIFAPKFNIAIEYNGLRWHSEKFGKDKNYHLSKTIECLKNGIKLLQIFEDEWLNKNDIVKSKILHIFGLNKKEKIMARKCDIKEILKEDSNKFLKKNHIESFTKSSINIGAFYNGELIGVASFLKSGENYILKRLATDINYICDGICSKLISFFEKNYQYKSLITFVDRRWSNDNNVFTICGFKKDEYIKPSYTFINGNKIERTKKSNTYTSLKSYKIYDCGSIKYIKKRSQK